MNAPLFDGDASADFYTITPLPMNAPLFDGDASDTSCLTYRNVGDAPLFLDGDASYSATLTLIRMSVRGLSASPVAMSCILPTTSIPSTTSPKTVYCPSRNGVPPDVVYSARCSSVHHTQPFSLQIFFVAVMRRSCNAGNPAWSRFFLREII